MSGNPYAATTGQQIENSIASHVIQFFHAEIDPGELNAAAQGINQLALGLYANLQHLNDAVVALNAAYTGSAMDTFNSSIWQPLAAGLQRAESQLNQVAGGIQVGINHQQQEVDTQNLELNAAIAGGIVAIILAPVWAPVVAAASTSLAATVAAAIVFVAEDAAAALAVAVSIGGPMLNNWALSTEAHPGMPGKVGEALALIKLAWAGLTPETLSLTFPSIPGLNLPGSTPGGTITYGGRTYPKYVPKGTMGPLLPGQQYAP